MNELLDSRRDVGPTGKLSRAREIVVGQRVRRDAHPGEAIEHDQRVVRPSAERLRARQQGHERGIARRACLHRTPREIVERWVVTAIGRGKRQLAAIVPLRAISGGSRLHRVGRNNEEENTERAAITAD